MKKVTISILISLILIGAFGMFFYLKTQEAVEKMVFGVKNVRLQDVDKSDTQSELPAADVAGVEILGLARYPAAVRSGYVVKDMAVAATMVTYQVEATSADVLSFYEKQMVAAGWGEARPQRLSVSDGGQAVLEDGKIIFIKGEDKVTIMARTNSFGITTFQIILEKF